MTAAGAATLSSKPRAGRREWTALVVLGLPTMVLSLDLNMLFLAAPHLSADLGASSTEQLWITDIYGFATAGFLITMGTLGDRIGRRKLLLTGAAVFGLTSLLAAYSTSPEMLIAARALLGIAGATLLPSTLALVRNMFRDPKQMGIAVAGWTTSYMAGVALGPVVGGAMLEHFWWGSVFLLAVPVMILLLVTGPALLPEHRDRRAGRPDLISMALSLVALLLVVYGLKELARHGLGVTSLVALVGGAGVGVIFIGRQRTLTTPFLDLRLFAISTIRIMLTVAVLIAVVQNGNMLTIAVYLQTVQELEPLRAGLWLVLPSGALVLTISATPFLTSRVRPGNLLAAGLGVSTVGFLIISQIGGARDMAIVMVGIVVVSAGIGPAAALINQLILGAAPRERAGTAASMASTSGELGIALGIATLGSLANLVYRSHVAVPAAVTGQPAQTARESIAGAVDTAGELPTDLRIDLLTSAREAFTAAVGTLATVSIVLFTGLAIFTAIALRHVPRIEP